MLVFHSKHDRNRVTVVGDFVENELILAASRCGDRENFSRKEGRTKAKGRLCMKHPRKCIECNKAPGGELIEKIIEKDYKFVLPTDGNNTTSLFVEQAAILADIINQKSSNVFKIIK